MHLRRWLRLLLILACATVVVPAQAQQTRNNVVNIDASRPGQRQDLLEPEEVKRLERIQTETVLYLPFSPPSPDDQTIFVLSQEQVGFLNLSDGTIRTIDPEAFGSLVPLPLAGFSRFAWLDNQHVGALAVDERANTVEEAFVKVRINRATLNISAERIRLPSDAAIVSVAPDLDRFLLALLPPEAEEEAGMSPPIRVPVTRVAPGVTYAAAVPLPPGLERAVARARAHPAFQRLWMRQEGEAETGDVAATPETLDLALFGRLDGSLRYVTTVPAASVLFGDTWTRDSGRLAMSIFGLLDPDQERPRFDGALLSEQVYRDVTGNLAPAENPILQYNNTYIVDWATGAVQIIQPSGVLPPILAAEAWSPDQRTLLVQAWHPARVKGRRYPIYTPQFSERTSYRFYDLSGVEVGRLESDLFSSGAFSSAVAEFISPDEIIFRAMKGTDRHPYYYNRVSGELRNLADRAGSYYNVFATNTSREIVFMFSSYTEPPEIYRLGWDGRGLKRLTWLNEELRLFANLRQDPVRFTLRNGQTRVGVLIQPADAPFPPRNAPLVVWQEGGPGVAMVNRWLVNVENPYALLPAMGFPLLVTPLAGRAGYTPAVFNALVDGDNFGAIDIDEQAEIVRQMIARGWTQQGKVGITGCSYGGYFTLQSLVRHPDLYAAANPQCAFIDLITDWTRGYDRLVPYIQGLPPYNIPEEYRRDSPAYNASRIKAAVLTFHGTEDFLPITQNENLHLQLANRGLPARMVRFIGEGHGLEEPANQLYAAQEQVAWFRAHLK
ncbi:MAG: prolyl oligopeptidase family serine peptidase [Chloroflexaceae bacterium]